MRQSK